MIDRHSGMSSVPKDARKTAKPGEAERAAVRELVKAARARAEDLTGPDGLLKTITATVLQAALEEEMTEHLATRITTPPRAITAMSVTGPGPRRCRLTPRVRWPSRCLRTAPERSRR